MHWKKSVLVIHKILGLFVNILTADDKHYLHNRDNLTQPIQIPLCIKQKNFSEFFLAFLKSILNFKHLPKKRWLSELMYFRKYRLRKIWLDKCLKGRVSEILRKTIWQIGRNFLTIWMAAPLNYLLITLKLVALEKLSFSNTQIPKTVC